MAKIIEAKAVISAEDRTGAAFSAIAKKMDGLAKNAKSAKAIDAVSKSLERAKSQMIAIDKLDLARGGLAASRQRFNEAKIAVEAHARAMKASSAPTREMVQNYTRAQRAVASASREFDRQRSSVSAVKRELDGMGISINKAAAHQKRLREATAQTTAAIERQHAKNERREIHAARLQRGVAIGGAALIAGARVKDKAKSAVVASADFDIATRKQREFTDINAVDQAKILTPQAKKIGQDTQFSNLDAVQAQTAAMQGLPSNITGKDKAEVAAGIMENVKNYALVMEADLKTSAEAVRSYLQTTGKDISTKEKAIAESTKAVNQMVRMAKLGGMSDEDVQAFLRYGAASATAAGVDPETMMSIGALARRGGLQGDTAGVFMRTTASKLSAPTRQGRIALNSAGINYDDYVRMPSSLDPDRLENQFRQDIGKGFTPAMKKRLTSVMSDQNIIGDRGRFTEAVTEIVSGMFKPKKDGKIAAADRAKIAKSAGAFHKTSAESVDTQALLDKIMSSNMTMAQLNAFFTDKHGGKAAITQKQREEYVAAREQLRGAGDDPNYAKRKADEIMGGLGGAFERLKGSTENLTLAIGNAFEPLTRPGFDKAGNFLDWISDLPAPVLGGGAAALGIGSVVGAGALTAKLMGGFGLGASAVALNASAASLTAAAAALGGGKVAAAAATAAGVAAPAAAAGASAAAWGAGVAALPYAAGALALGGGLGVIRGSVESAGFVGLTSGERTRRSRGGSIRDARRRAWGYDDVSAPAISDTTVFGTGVGGDRSVSVSGEVSGEAKLTIGVSSEFITLVDQAKQAVKLSGSLRGNGPGSTGKSSPDAAAPSTGATGNW